MTIVTRAELLVAAAWMLACTGEIAGKGTGAGPDEGESVPGGGGTNSAAPTPEECETTIAPGRTPLRRLTATEYNNTVKDLIGDASAPADKFPPPEESAGFLNNADVYTTTELHVEAWFNAA